MAVCRAKKKPETLGVEKKAGMKISKKSKNNVINYFGENRQQQHVSLRKKNFDHK
jgi:hypothetical protein